MNSFQRQNSRFGSRQRARQGLDHEVVVVGRQVNRQRKVGQDAVGLIGRSKVRSGAAAQPLQDELLGVGQVVLHREELRNPDEIRVIGHRIVEPLSPFAGDLSPERQSAVTRTRPQERHALARRDAPQQDLPVPIGQCTCHWLAKPQLFSPCQIERADDGLLWPSNSSIIFFCSSPKKAVAFVFRPGWQVSRGK